MEQYAFFLDLDGTLLNDDKEVSPGNRAALRWALKEGHKIVIASGRPLVSVRKLARSLELDGPGCYLIAFNGAVLYDCGADREAFRVTIPQEQLFTLFDEARRRGVYIQAYDREQVVVERGADLSITRRYCERVGMTFREIDSIRNLEEPSVKALLIDFAGREKTEPVRQWINALPGHPLDSYFSDLWFLETVPAGMNKGRAVVSVCEMIGVPVANSVAMGDEANDLTMLKAAGVGVAMRNGTDEAKAAADRVTERDNNHDGVAETILSFIAPENGTVPFEQYIP